MTTRDLQEILARTEKLAALSRNPHVVPVAKPRPPLPIRKPKTDQ